MPKRAGSMWWLSHGQRNDQDYPNHNAGEEN
jgi:hypothetical protein